MNTIQAQHTSKQLTSFESEVASFSDLLSAIEVTDRKKSGIEPRNAIAQAVSLLLKARAEKGTAYLVGNGGGAAIASHIVNDFAAAKMKATALHESALLTGMANDYGYENAYARILESYIRPGDLADCIRQMPHQA